MKIEPSGVIFNGVCEIQTDRCLARNSAPITAVWRLPAREQVNVCRPCLEEKVRDGEWEISGAKIRPRADVAVLAPDGKLVLVVEVKRLSLKDAELKQQAIQVHRNLIRHAGIPATTYFLFVNVPSHFFLWKETESAGTEDPHLAIHDDEILKPYLQSASDAVTEFQMEKLVSIWLEDILRHGLPDSSSHRWLHDSGLYEALKGGRVEMQVPTAA